MPKNQPFEICGRVTFEYRTVIEARDEDHALGRLEWFMRNMLRFNWKGVRFPKARATQDVYIEDTDHDIDVDSIEVEEL